jgi:hypothetical protein
MTDAGQSGDAQLLAAGRDRIQPSPAHPDRRMPTELPPIRSVVDPPSEEPPAEEPPAEQPPTEEPPLEDPGVDDPPIEEPPSEMPVVQEPVMAEAPEAPVEIEGASEEPEMLEVWRVSTGRPNRPANKGRPSRHRADAPGEGQQPQQRFRNRRSGNRDIRPEVTGQVAPPAHEQERRQGSEQPASPHSARPPRSERPQRRERDRPQARVDSGQRYDRPQRNDGPQRNDRPQRNEGPQRNERPVDPDSPFAALAALKKTLENSNRE